MSRARSLVTGRGAEIAAGRSLLREYCNRMRIGTCWIFALVIILMFKPVKAGEIPGLPPALLPLIDRDFAILHLTSATIFLAAADRLMIFVRSK